MTVLNNYLNDGANHQAKAVLCLLNYNIGDGLEDSWSEEKGCYEAEIFVSRWENGREQGYVISLRNKKRKQINIAFFEHRNSNNISAVEWEQNTINSPTIDSAEFGDIYKSKWDVSYEVNYSEILKMSKWIEERLNFHWYK